MSTTWEAITKIGSGYEYNEVGYAYNQDKDPNTGAEVYYNSAGIATVWTEISKP